MGKNMSCREVGSLIADLPFSKLRFYAFVVFAFCLAILSCATKYYWATEFISYFVDIHVFNTSTRMQFETLIWVLLITFVQFYTYYAYTLGLYDEITLEKVSRGTRSRHFLLQLILSALIFLAASILCLTALLAVMSNQIMNEHNIDASKIIFQFLPMLKIDFLLLYFVLIDAVLVAINSNFSACRECSEEKRERFKEARRELWPSIGFGLFFCIITLIFSGLDPSNSSVYHRIDNLEIKLGSLVLLASIGALQVFYVLIDMFFTFKTRGAG